MYINKEGVFHDTKTFIFIAVDGRWYHWNGAYTALLSVIQAYIPSMHRHQRSRSILVLALTGLPRGKLYKLR